MLTRQDVIRYDGHDLVPYVIEPDEICIPVRAVPMAVDEPTRVGPYIQIEVERIRFRSRRRVARIAGGAVALVVLMIATAGTLMSAPRVASPPLPAPPVMLAALPSGPLSPLDTKELPVVDGLSGITTDSLFSSAAQFSGVVLVRGQRGQDRTSMALEMTAEPGKATLHALSPTVLEIQAGPTTGPINSGWFVSSALPLLNQVSIRKLTRDHHDYVQARVMLNAPGTADVRVVGRVVYVDLLPLGYDTSQKPPTTIASTAAAVMTAR